MTGDWIWPALGFALAAVVIAVLAVEADRILSRWRSRR
jgi:hypothetical protein